ncbi:hypothetical protein RhiirA5_433135 [Rhizophagus irregularis]|uniref:Uncharacterized protein n=1 Tax=Rhizophagus irregularis TaxID=588596 RepID=A0A2I1EPT4_9GLOM|nr:hypothetical protein RhiirA5_433135 [Rhizophagus irregularis]PKY24141.1 hypothetical protein RhiirB3_438588 [Rhizophagus irregularis]
MEKDPECTRNLLIWIQEAIKAGKLIDPTFSENEKRNTRAFSKIALRHKIVCHDVGKSYAIADTELEDSDSEDKHNSEPESESTENDKISEIINMYSY